VIGSYFGLLQDKTQDFGKLCHIKIVNLQFPKVAIGWCDIEPLNFLQNN